MKKIVFLLWCVFLLPANATSVTENTLPSEDVLAKMSADELLDAAEQAYQLTATVCSGIADEISDISGISIANTVVTGVGAVAGGGALYAGLKKNTVDKRIEELSKMICEKGGCDPKTVESMTEQEFLENVLGPMAEMAALMELKDGIRESRKLGNWRTGLLAGASATHIASAIMSGINVNQSELYQHVLACNNAINELEKIKHRIQAVGMNPKQMPTYIKIDRAIFNCKLIDMNDVKKIEEREKWVLGSSIVGGTSAIAGTVTSAMANSDGVRNKNDEAGKKKEKNLNNASNVLAGVSTVGSLVSTGFNVSLIDLTKNMMKTAKYCEETLSE